MNSHELHSQLDVYLGLRQALGYQQTAWESKLLGQLVEFIDRQAPTGRR